MPTSKSPIAVPYMWYQKDNTLPGVAEISNVGVYTINTLFGKLGLDDST